MCEGLDLDAEFMECISGERGSRQGKEKEGDEPGGEVASSHFAYMGYSRAAGGNSREIKKRQGSHFCLTCFG